MMPSLLPSFWRGRVADVDGTCDGMGPETNSWVSGRSTILTMLLASGRRSSGCRRCRCARPRGPCPNVAAGPAAAVGDGDLDRVGPGMQPIGDVEPGTARHPGPVMEP